MSKKNNKSFNSSSYEKQMASMLKSYYGDKSFYEQYFDSRYPFMCDFYIKDYDIFIELNIHWTHGGMPFDSDDENCNKKLKKWTDKAVDSNFYKNAINVWTVRDVEKNSVAKQNRLNYIAIYTIDEFNVLLNAIKNN